MSKQNKTFLITGFGPFPGASSNPSHCLIEELQTLTCFTGKTNAGIFYLTLPTDWKKLPRELNRAYDRVNPDISLHLGYAPSSPGFQLETTAYNQTCDLQDVAGRAGSCGPVCAKTPAQLHSALPVQKLRMDLAANGINTTTSDDPGRYLCNMAYYLALHLSPGNQALFIHIPAIKTHLGELVPQGHEGDNVLTLQEARLGMAVIINALDNQHRNP